MRHSAPEKTGSCATTQDLPVTGSKTSNNCVNNNIEMKSTKLVKNDSVEEQHEETQEIDPFTNKLSWSVSDVIKVSILSLTLAPLRLICILLIVIFTWIVSKITLMGITFEESTSTPFTGWRKNLQWLVHKTMRAIAFCMGIHRIKVKGEQASKTSAPILVAAPHSTIVDGLAVVQTFSSVVAKQELASWPIFGSIATVYQSVFIMRQAADSRKNVHDLIKNRALEPSWPQVFLYPEGTVTNAKALIKFKVGAFKPGVPVQPVLIRHDTRQTGRFLDTLTKTWNQGHGYLGCLWLTLCQFQTDLEFEFLPVYRPSEEELINPIAYAENVRALMAEKLKIPMVDRSVSEFRNMMK